MLLKNCSSNLWKISSLYVLASVVVLFLGTFNFPDTICSYLKHMSDVKYKYSGMNVKKHKLSYLSPVHHPYGCLVRIPGDFLP